MTCPHCGQTTIESDGEIELAMQFRIPATKYECEPCGYTRLVPKDVPVPAPTVDPEPPA